MMADYRLIGLSIVISITWLAVRGLVWRTLLQEKAPFSQVFWTLNEGYLLNNFLPFRLGEIARSFILSKKANLDFWEVFSTIVIERALDMTMAISLLFSTLPFVVGASWAGQAMTGVSVVVLIGLTVLYLLARNRQWVLTIFGQYSSRWPVLQKIGGGALPAFLNGLAVLTDGRRFLIVILLMVLNWSFSVAQYYILVSAFFPGARVLWSTFTLAVTALGVAAPSSPGAIGVLEGAMVGSLSVFHLDPSVATACAITAHLINYLFTGILGAYALTRDGETLIGLYQRVRLRKDAG
jgi:hypothetical protein